MKMRNGGIPKKVGPALKQSAKGKERSEQVKAWNKWLGYWVIGLLGHKAQSKSAIADYFLVKKSKGLDWIISQIL